MKLSLTFAFTSALALLLLACQPTETPPPQPSTPDALGLSVRKGRLVFSSVEAYRQVVDDASLETKARFTEAVSSLRDFTSLYEKQERQARLGVEVNDDGRLLKSGYFKQMLNPDLVVQIGANLFKINPRAEKVYVLPAALENQYADLLAGNVSNPNLRQFSTKDDVLELIENGARNARGAPPTCSEVTYPIQRTTYDTAFENGKELGFTTEFNYDYIGIYFSMSTSMSCVELPGNTPFKTDMRMTYSGFFHKNCNSTGGDFSDFKEKLNKASFEHSFYEGAKSLKRLNLRIDYLHPSTNLDLGTFNFTSGN